MHIYRLSLMYILIFLIPDRASRSRDIRWSSLREVADDADEVDTREQGAWRLPEVREGWKQTKQRSVSVALVTRNSEESSLFQESRASSCGRERRGDRGHGGDAAWIVQYSTEKGGDFVRRGWKSAGGVMVMEPMRDVWH